MTAETPTTADPGGRLHPDVALVSGVGPFTVALRVLHVAQPVAAGVRGYVREAARHQAAGGWDVHVAAPEALGEPGVIDQSWTARREPWRGTADEVRRLGRIVAEVDPDVVVLHSAKAGLVGRLCLRGRVPTVYLPHAWSWLALPAPVAPAAVAWERLAARWTSTVVAVSDGEAAAGRTARVRAPFHVVPNPLPPGWVEVPPSAAQAARAELGLPPGPVAVCVGRLSRQKGQDVLLSAWPRVRELSPHATLVLVGDGPAEAALRAAAPPGLVFAGAVDPHPWVAAADVVVLPSRWEGLSLALLEAMAAGRPVVTTRVAGSEVVSAAGSGAVVPVGAPGPLALAVAARLGTPQEATEEGRRGADHVRRHHDPQVALERLAAVISRARVFGATG